MPPASIIILRHGHRIDHFTPGWKKTADRPHDSPLNEEGKQAATRAGVFSFNHLLQNISEMNNKKNINNSHISLLKLEDFIIMSSPLIRTIETSNCFATGLEAAYDKLHQTDTAKTLRIPIHLETAMIEPAFWMTHDIQAKGHKKGDPYEGFVHHDAEFLNENVSPRVLSKKNNNNNNNNNKQVRSFEDAEEENNNDDSTASNNKEPSAASPLLASPMLLSPQFKSRAANNKYDPLFDVTHSRDPETGGFKEDVECSERFFKAAQKLFSSPQFDGKHCVLTGHGASTVQFFNGLLQAGVKIHNCDQPFDGSPHYTGMAMLLFDGEKYHQICEPFTTPHDE